MVEFAEIVFAASRATATQHKLGAVLVGLVLAALVVLAPILFVYFYRRNANVEPPNDPPDGPALGENATRAALHLQAARAFGIVAAGLLLAVAVGALAPAAGAAGLIISAAGVVCLLSAVRIWWILRRQPWQALECRFREVPGFGNGSPTLVVSGPTDREEFVLGVVSFKWRWRALNACDRAEVWMAGNPARGGVVSPPGGTQLLWVRRPIDAKRRESLGSAVLGFPFVDGGKAADLSKAQIDEPG